MKNGLRIHVINNYFFPVTAGIETAILQTFSRLQQWGHHVTMHTSRNTLHGTNVLPRADVVKGMKIFRYDWIPHLGFFPRIDVSACDVVVIENFDIFPHLRVFAWILWLKLTQQKKFSVVVAPHGSFTPLWQVFPTFTRYIRFVYYHTLGVLLINSTADVIQVLSEAEHLHMRKFGVDEHKMVTISNGVEPEALLQAHAVSNAFEKKISSLGRYVVQLARIDPVKNMGSAVVAMTHAPADVKLVIAGDVNDVVYKQYLDLLVKKHGLQDRVVFLGVVKGAEKFYLLQHALCMVHMAMAETQSIAIWEGMSQGLICIVSNQSGMTETVHDGVNGFCFPSDAVERIGAAITNVVEKAGTPAMVRMQEANRKATQVLSWTSVAELMESTLVHATHTKVVPVHLGGL